jgi:uncharacterized membrane protein (DUF485 family)
MATPAAALSQVPARAGAEDERQLSDWDRVAMAPEFRALVAQKLRFIVPATVFFVAYYFALPILVGYAPDLMDRRVLGPLNIAYLFALSQFFMAWILAGLYVRTAAGWDRTTRELLASLRSRRS